MYSTCIFCDTGLGSNEVVEQFPVGRRLAFDAAKGRLWVVCRACERWNLSPLGERWEVIEECERSFRDAHVRVSTEQIGLARLAEGTELVRVGRPLRPEFAAWRYGDQFGARARRMWMLKIALGGLGVVAAGAAVVASPMLLLGLPLALIVVMCLRDAHQLDLWNLPQELRLALEMAAREDARRRAMEGELAELERRWRAAEEIAAIADRLAIPQELERKLDGLRGERDVYRPE